MKSSRSKKKKEYRLLINSNYEYRKEIRLFTEDWFSSVFNGLLLRVLTEEAAPVFALLVWKIQTAPSFRFPRWIRVDRESEKYFNTVLKKLGGESSRRGKRRAGLFERVGSVKSSKRREKLYCFERKDNFLNFEKRRCRVGQRDVINDWKLINNRWSLITFLI